MKRRSQRLVLDLLMTAATFAAEKGLDRLSATKPSAAAAGTAVDRTRSASAAREMTGAIRHEQGR